MRNVGGKGVLHQAPTGIASETYDLVCCQSVMQPLDQQSCRGAQGIGNPFARLWTGAREELRTLSYYEMKNRAGVIGQQGLGPLLANLAGPSGAPRIHLIGHSFGARLVCLRLVQC